MHHISAQNEGKHVLATSILHKFLGDQNPLEAGAKPGFSNEGSHCVKHYRHGVLATEYYRLFSKKGLQRGGGGVTGPQDSPRYPLEWGDLTLCLQINLRALLYQQVNSVFKG